MLTTPSEPDNRPGTPRSAFCCPVLFYGLVVIAAVMSLSGLFAVGCGIWIDLGVDPPLGLIGALTSVGAGLVLIGLAAILFLMTLYLRSAPSQPRPAGQAGLGDVRPADLPARATIQQIDARVTELGQAMAQVVQQLREINENTLLDDRGRENKLELLAQQHRKAVFLDVDRLVRSRDWARAKLLLEGLKHRYPDTVEVSEALDRLDGLRKQAFDDDLAQAKKLINDLIAISAWDKATAQAEALLEKHPDMAEPKELLANVSAERQKFRTEQIKRISADVQQNVNRRRWTEATQAAGQLIEKYPDSTEAEALKNRLPTLQANAEIEKRQQLEEQIKDLVRRRNFIQARELAKHVIETYPDSPQAQALRAQTPKLEELAREQESNFKI